MAEGADGSATILAKLQDTALDLLGQADAALDGRLWVVLVGVALLLIVLAIPQRRGSGPGEPWPRLWACGAVGGLAAVVMLIAR